MPKPLSPMTSPARRHRLLTPAILRPSALPVALVILMLLGATLARIGAQTAHAALYPDDRRQAMTEADMNRFTGPGVLMCFSDFGTLERA
ncbi:MAG: serine protease, partial [Methylocystis sp.]|nr:serine protease [Methylocystis sp.]